MKEWRDELAKKYPTLYKRYKGDPKITTMAWGFAVGDGWKGILEKLSSKISEIDKRGYVVVDQVKEKFGGLRYYFHVEGKNEDEGLALYNKVELLVADAERESEETCEKCGQPGKLITGPFGWIRVLCDECQKEIKE